MVLRVLPKAALAVNPGPGLSGFIEVLECRSDQGNGVAFAGLLFQTLDELVLVYEMGVQVRFNKGWMREKNLKKRDRGSYPSDFVFAQCSLHAEDRLLAIFPIGDDLGNEWIIFHRDR